MRMTLQFETNGSKSDTEINVTTQNGNKILIVCYAKSWENPGLLVEQLMSVISYSKVTIFIGAIRIHFV